MKVLGTEILTIQTAPRRGDLFHEEFCMNFSIDFQCPPKGF